MINLTWSRAWRLAVGPRLERGVRRHWRHATGEPPCNLHIDKPAAQHEEGAVLYDLLIFFAVGTDCSWLCLILGGGAKGGGKPTNASTRKTGSKQ